MWVKVTQHSIQVVKNELGVEKMGINQFHLSLRVIGLLRIHILLTWHSQESTQRLPDPFSCVRVGSGHKWGSHPQRVR